MNFRKTISEHFPTASPHRQAFPGRRLASSLGIAELFVLSITQIHAIRMLSDKVMREIPMLVHPASAPTEQPPRKLSGTRTA